MWSARARPTPRLFADYKQGAGNPEKLMEAFKRSIPLGRIGQPDDLPGAILFFASRRRRLRHRPGAERVRRPDHGRLTPTPQSIPLQYSASKTTCNSKTSPTKSATAWPGSLINRPDKMNAFRGQTCDELIKALQQGRL